MLLLDAIVAAVIEPTYTVTYDRTAAVSRDYDRPACRNALALLLARVGWHGRDNRTAWAVAMRESNGIASTPDGGLFQLKASVWGGTRFWPTDVNDAESNARAAFRLWKRSSWRPWGLNASGTDVDARDYGGWGSDLISAWIWQPYAEWRAAYPCEVAP